MVSKHILMALGTLFAAVVAFFLYHYLVRRPIQTRAAAVFSTFVGLATLLCSQVFLYVPRLAWALPGIVPLFLAGVLHAILSREKRESRALGSSREDKDDWLGI